MNTAKSTRWMMAPFHPFLIAAYPVLYLMSRNVEYVEFDTLIRPLAVVLAGAVLLFGVLRLILREAHRAAAATSAVLLMFFTYPIYSSEPYQIVLAVILFVLVLGYIAVKRTEWRRATQVLNPFAFVLVVFCVAGLVRPFTSDEEYTLSTESSADATSKGSAPNIYYFILDAYGSEEVLRSFYDYDNSGFVAFLREQGFVVNDGARSNYPWTIPSLTTTLNYEHASVIAAEFELSGESQLPMVGVIRNNRAMAYLRGQGYAIHGYMPGYMRWNLVGADHLHRPWWAPTEFESTLLNYTPLPVLLHYGPLPSAYSFHRRLQLHTLESAAGLADLPSPKLAFVHLICPHPPFVFGPNGEPREPQEPRFTLKDAGALIGDVISQEDYVEGYRDQVAFLNSRLKPVVTRLRKEDPGAIIVIQGDHGPASRSNFADITQTNMKERFGILNAVYFPDGGLEEKDIKTPVNTFRHIFNRYFGTSLELLPDASYFALFAEPYEYYRITFPDEVAAESAAAGSGD